LVRHCLDTDLSGPGIDVKLKERKKERKIQIVSTIQQVGEKERSCQSVKNNPGTE
jgi:hypothetical protein